MGRGGMGLPRLQLPDLEDREFGRKGKGGSKHRGQCHPLLPRPAQTETEWPLPEGPQKRPGGAHAWPAGA